MRIKEDLGMEENKRKHVISITPRTCLRLGITVFLIFLAITLWKPFVNLLGDVIAAAASLILGAVLAYIVNILMSLYEKHYFKKRADRKWVTATRRPVCLILAIATIAGVIALILWIVIPQLMKAVTLITEQIPDLLKSITENEKIMSLLPEEIQDALKNTDYQSLVEGVIKFLTEGASSSGGFSLVSILGALTSGFMTCFMGFIFSIYILLGKEKIGGQLGRVFKCYLSVGWVEKIRSFFAVVNECFRNFIIGQVTEAIIIGVLCGLGMWVLRLPYAAMVGTVIGVTALIPILGCYLGAFIGALMCLSVSPVKAIEFLVFIFCLQQFEDNLIYPRVVGTSIGLPAIWVIASVSIGGGVGGLLGMILAVPVTATIYKLLGMSVRKRERADSNKLTAAEFVGRLKSRADD